MSTTADAVLSFWFGQLSADGVPDPSCPKRWFQGGAALDQEIRAHFGEAVEQALAGDLAAWCETPRGALALVILLDQFTRNSFRGSPRAFAGDPLALSIARDLVASGLDQQLLPVERSFLYMPFEHSEDLADQEHAVALFEQLAAAAPPPLRALLASSLDYARQHRDIIRRFGRFPHRNLLLGRSATPEEAAWLDQGGQRFGQ